MASDVLTSFTVEVQFDPDGISDARMEQIADQAASIEAAVDMFLTRLGQELLKQFPRVPGLKLVTEMEE